MLVLLHFCISTLNQIPSSFVQSSVVTLTLQLCATFIFSWFGTGLDLQTGRRVSNKQRVLPAQHKLADSQSKD